MSGLPTTCHQEHRPYTGITPALVCGGTLRPMKSMQGRVLALLCPRCFVDIAVSQCSGCGADIVTGDRPLKVCEPCEVQGAHQRLGT